MKTTKISLSLNTKLEDEIGMSFQEDNPRRALLFCFSILCGFEPYSRIENDENPKLRRQGARKLHSLLQYSKRIEFQ
jgi:hypothetical protein